MIQDPESTSTHDDEMLEQTTTSMFLFSLSTVVVIILSRSNVANAWVNLNAPTGAATRTLPVAHRHRSKTYVCPAAAGQLKSLSALGTHPGTGDALCSVERTMRPSPFQGRRRRRTLSAALACVQMTPKRAVIGGTFVEGDDYESSLEEIEAMGGDPSFLGAYTAQPGDGSDVKPGPSKGASSGWDVNVDEGWNGVADDNAHFDFD